MAPRHDRDPRDADVEERQREIVEARPEGDERHYTGEPLDTGDGIDRPTQQNTGAQAMRGAGEWPDPDTPPTPSSAGWDESEATDEDSAGAHDEQ